MRLRRADRRAVTTTLPQHFAVETMCNAEVGTNTLATACEVILAAGTADRLRAAFPELFGD